MTLEKERRTIVVFAKCSDAQLALQELKASNFPMHKVSVIARNAEEQSDIAGVEVKDSTSNISSEEADQALTGSALGDLNDLLAGLVSWVAPGVGQVMVAGAQAIAIASNLAGCLPDVLVSLGIPKEQAEAYSDLVCKGYHLVMITGIDIEIRLAKRIFNRGDLQHLGLYEPYSTPNSRYKRAIGVFSRHHNLERALTELRTAGFPMSQVSIIAKIISNISDIVDVNISSSQDIYPTLGIPNDIARYYQHQVASGNYLVVIKGTDIYIAGARAILESNNIQDFSIHSQSELDLARSDRQSITNF
ncbi:hypothetical protein GNF10_30460 [Nostoc sp. UCD121]|uniref:hypothetical protein n=1 Tax=unclassified Nostoc TaxID=2593658 RepID=UPI00162A9079|nr:MULTISPECIES: hypothetical protein [unclassified Nostoc]MBC1225223.1 hypothetical protein [Nostoc sp. UCD120]MBC1280155.1 hypothetical protein [Nostoc sp. UCD121]MBC1298532.1 hypothetical protein [Nostoc sp. UCD122]